MFLYENEKCPVCSKPFEKGDDIVTCPDCGTPHHRECYKDYGGCKNRSLHGTDFVYKKGDTAANASVERNFKYKPFLSELPFGEEEEQGKYYKPEEAEASENPQEDNSAESFTEAAPEATEPTVETTEAAEKDDEIDGVSMDDIACVVAINPIKFLPKFKRKSLFNWNWSALIFGPFYFFFRKMYVQGAVFAAIQYGLRLAITAAFLPAFIAAAKVVAEVKTMADYYAASANFMSDPQYQNFMTGSALIMLSFIIVHIVCALLADGFYRKKVINVVKIVDEKVKMGESFSLMGPMAVMESNMSQKDMRKIFLSRQGGVSTLAPLIAYIIIQLVLNMLNAF